MSLFSWKKVKVDTSAEVTLSDEKKAQIDAVVASWGEVTRTGRKSTYDGSDPPVQIITAEEVAYFVHAMEEEAGRIDAAATELQKKRLAEIAERDAQIASINREIEAMKAKARTETDEINRRAETRAKLLAVVAKVAPQLDAKSILKDADLRCEAVRHVFGASAVDGRSEAYVDERFESLEVRANVDPVRAAMLDRKPGDDDLRGASERAYQQMVADLNNWRH
jgi:hypothetical protein